MRVEEEMNPLQVCREEKLLEDERRKIRKLEVNRNQNILVNAHFYDETTKCSSHWQENTIMIDNNSQESAHIKRRQNA